MTIEEDFAFLRAWLSERGGERAKAALSRIEDANRLLTERRDYYLAGTVSLRKERGTLKAALEQETALVVSLDDTVLALKAALRRISELAPYQSIEGIRLARQALAKLEKK